MAAPAPAPVPAPGAPAPAVVVAGPAVPMPTAGSSAAVTFIDPSVMVRQIAMMYKAEFESAFVFSKNGTLRCKAEDIARFQVFFRRWDALLLNRGVAVQVVEFEPQGQADVDAVNRNKYRLLQVYGVYFLIYQGECKFLREAPNPNAVLNPDLD